MSFTAAAGKHSFNMDTQAPLGSDTAPTPKQLLLAGVAGCTAMDVVALLKKYRQEIESFDVEVEGEASSGYPSVFPELRLTFRLHGKIESEKALEAVRLSQTKYCGVSAMISKGVPIHYVVELNGVQVGAGNAQF